jgi:hypothetical protein
VGEVEPPDPVVPSRALGVGSGSEERYRSPVPQGVGRAFRSLHELGSRYSVHGSRHAVSTTSRVFRNSLSGARTPDAIRCRSTGSSHRLGPLLGTNRTAPAGVLRGSGYPLGVLRPYSDIGLKVHSTRDSRPGTFRLQGFSPS